MSTFLEIAEKVLRKAKDPMSPKEIWQYTTKKMPKEIESEGKTPVQSLTAILCREIRDNENTIFIQKGSYPARYFLKSREKDLSKDIVETLDEKLYDEPIKSYKEESLKERSLDPLLIYFAYTDTKFNRGRPVYTKTIIAQESKKRKQLMRWMHPDIVGFSSPQVKDWKKEVLQLNQKTDRNCLKLYSFEIKKRLGVSNIRESYFQAVSNSSWAHEGYLVALEIEEDPEFLAELQRLTSAFGIGIIQLNPSIGDSIVLFQATTKESLDWETINKICVNDKFKAFIDNVCTCSDGNINKEHFEQALDEKGIKKYIKKNKVTLNS